MRRMSVLTGVVAVVMTSGALLAPAAGAATRSDTPDPSGDSSASAPIKPSKVVKHSRPVAKSDADRDAAGGAQDAPGDVSATHQGKVAHPAADDSDDQAGISKPGKPVADSDSEYSQPQDSKPRHSTHPARSTGEQGEDTAPKTSTGKGVDDGSAVDNGKPAGKSAPSATEGTGAGKATGPAKAPASTPAVTDESPDSAAEAAKPSHTRTTTTTTEQGDDQQVSSQTTRPAHKPLARRIHRLPHLRRGFRPVPHNAVPVTPEATATPATTQADDPQVPAQTTRPAHKPLARRIHRLPHLHRGLRPVPHHLGTISPTTPATSGTPGTAADETQAAPVAPATPGVHRRVHRLVRPLHHRALRHPLRPLHHRRPVTDPNSVEGTNLGEGEHAGDHAAPAAPATPTTPDAPTTPHVHSQP